MRYSLLLSLVALCSTVAARNSESGATQHGSFDKSSSENDTRSYGDTQTGVSVSNNAYGAYTPASKTVVTVSKASKTAKAISTNCTTKADKGKNTTTKVIKETANANSHTSKNTITKASKQTAKAYSHASKDTKVSQGETKTTKTHLSGGNKTMTVDSKAMHTTIMMEHTTTVVKTITVQYTHSVSKTLVMGHVRYSFSNPTIPANLPKTTIVSIILSTETAAMLYTTTNIIFSTETAAPNFNTIFSTKTHAPQAPLTTNIIVSTETAKAITTGLPVMSFSTIKTGTTSSLAKQVNATAPAAIFTGGAVQGTVGQKSGFFGAGLIGLLMLFL